MMQYNENGDIYIRIYFPYICEFKLFKQVTHTDSIHTGAFTSIYLYIYIISTWNTWQFRGGWNVPYCVWILSQIRFQPRKDISIIIRGAL